MGIIPYFENNKNCIGHEDNQTERRLLQQRTKLEKFIVTDEDL